MKKLLSQLPTALSTFIDLYKRDKAPIGLRSYGVHFDGRFGNPGPWSLANRLSVNRCFWEEVTKPYIDPRHLDYLIAETLNLIITGTCKSTEPFYQENLQASISNLHDQIVIPTDEKLLAEFEAEYREIGHFNDEDYGYKDALKLLDDLNAISQMLASFVKVTSRHAKKMLNTPSTNLGEDIKAYLMIRNIHLNDTNTIFRGMDERYTEYTTILPCYFYREVVGRIKAVHLLLELSLVVDPNVEYLCLRDLFPQLGISYAEAGQILSYVVNEDIVINFGKDC
ncbi:MAG: hypothetical protein ACRDBQ_18945 [Shewanella sp.]